MDCNDNDDGFGWMRRQKETNRTTRKLIMRKQTYRERQTTNPSGREVVTFPRNTYTKYNKHKLIIMPTQKYGGTPGAVPFRTVQNNACVLNNV